MQPQHHQNLQASCWHARARICSGTLKRDYLEMQNYIRIGAGMPEQGSRSREAVPSVVGEGNTTYRACIPPSLLISQDMIVDNVGLANPVRLDTSSTSNYLNTSGISAWRWFRAAQGIAQGVRNVASAPFGRKFDVL